MTTETVAIDRMSYGPAGIGRLPSGKTVFVEGTAPSDVCEVAVTEEKARYAQAELLRLVAPSPLRAENPPACAKACGGCPWAQISYEEQLHQKCHAVIEALVRVAKLERSQAESLVQPGIPAPHIWGFRNKIELGVARDEDGRLIVGFHGKKSADLVPIDACPAAVKLLQKLPRSLEGTLHFLAGDSVRIASNDRDDPFASLHRIGARASLRTRSLEVALWSTPGPFPRARATKVLTDAIHPTSLVRVLAERGSARAVKGLEVLAGSGFWRERLCGARFRVSAPSFFQVNTEQAERLIEKAIEGLNLTSGAQVADLYAGVGTFSVALANRGATVVAIEMAGSSVRDMKANKGERRIAVVGGDVARELSSMRGLDAVVVDPPRTGLSPEALKALSDARPQQIAYVSCNPQTWARDASALIAQGWHLQRAVPIDLFPQTYHIEVVSHFARD